MKLRAKPSHRLQSRVGYVVDISEDDVKHPDQCLLRVWHEYNETLEALCSIRIQPDVGSDMHVEIDAATATRLEEAKDRMLRKLCDLGNAFINYRNVTGRCLTPTFTWPPTPDGDSTMVTIQ